MELETILEGIRVHRESIIGNWNDPTVVSEVALKLATYNANLAEHLGPLHKEATDAQAKAYLQYKAEGMSDTGSENRSRFDSTSERETYENAKFVYKSTETMISMAQSTIRTIQTQIEREGQL